MEEWEWPACCPFPEGPDNARVEDRMDSEPAEKLEDYPDVSSFSSGMDAKTPMTPWADCLTCSHFPYL